MSMEVNLNFFVKVTAIILLSFFIMSIIMTYRATVIYKKWAD